MNLREIFQETKGVWKKNKTILLGFSMAVFAVLFAVIVAYIFVSIEWSFLIIGLTIALVFPLFVGIDYIAKKAVSGEELDYRDFYLGHRNFLTSLTLETKVLARGILFYCLGTFITTFVLMFAVNCYIMVDNPEIMLITEGIMKNQNTFTDLINALTAISWYETAITVIDVTSLLMGGAFYIWQGKRYTFLPFICFETRFNLQTAVYLSKESSDSIRKSFFAYNILYYVLVVLVAALSVGAYYLSVLFTTETVSLVIAFAIACLILAPIFLFYKISIYVIYTKNFKEEIDKAFKIKLEEAKQKGNL